MRIDSKYLNSTVIIVSISTIETVALIAGSVALGIGIFGALNTINIAGSYAWISVGGVTLAQSSLFFFTLLSSIACNKLFYKKPIPIDVVPISNREASFNSSSIDDVPEEITVLIEPQQSVSQPDVPPVSNRPTSLSTPNLADLPEELLAYILSFNNPAELANMRMTSKHFRRIALEDSLWKKICHREGISLKKEDNFYTSCTISQSLKRKIATTKSQYRRLYETRKGSNILFWEGNFYLFNSRNAILYVLSPNVLSPNVKKEWHSNIIRPFSEQFRAFPSFIGRWEIQDDCCFVRCCFKKVKKQELDYYGIVFLKLSLSLQDHPRAIFFKDAKKDNFFTANNRYGFVFNEEDRVIDIWDLESKCTILSRDGCEVIKDAYYDEWATDKEPNLSKILVTSSSPFKSLHASTTHLFCVYEDGKVDIWNLFDFKHCGFIDTEAEEISSIKVHKNLFLMSSENCITVFCASSQEKIYQLQNEEIVSTVINKGLLFYATYSKNKKKSIINIVNLSNGKLIKKININKRIVDIQFKNKILTAIANITITEDDEKYEILTFDFS